MADPLDVDADRAPRSVLRTAVDGTLLNVLNPKLSLFFLAFLPQFIPPGTQDAIPAMTLLASVFMLLTFIVFVGYGACASLVRDYIVSRPSILNWMKRSFAAAFAFLGLRLALSDR
jgi:threonine/homoserine/homoserine lactone efflux protein